MATKSTCLKSIAFELGISINTVSRALRDCSDISEATKEKVRQKAIEMGYVTNSVSQFIKRDSRKLIAIVLNSFMNSYFQIICDKLVAILDEMEFDFTIIYSPTKKLTSALLKQCISERVDGIITLLEPEDSVIEYAKINQLPIVMLGRKLSKDYVDEIYTDDELGGAIAANYLANFHSIDKYIYIKMPEVESSVRKQNAFLSTIKKNDNRSEVIILEPKDLDISLINYINDGYLGVFCFSDELAYQFISCLNKCVPNIRKVYPHLHIVGFDAVSLHVTGMADLTSITFDYKLLALKAVDMIRNRFENPNRDKMTMKLPVSLHARKYIS